MFELLRNLNIKLAAVQHSCCGQVIIKFLSKISHWLSKGNILIIIQNFTRKLYTVSVFEANEHRPSETSLNVDSLGIFCFTLFYLQETLFFGYLDFIAALVFPHASKCLGLMDVNKSKK